MRCYLRKKIFCFLLNLRFPLSKSTRQSFFLPVADCCDMSCAGNDSNLLIVFYVQIMPDDFVMQLHRF
ncbi:hypothetical protein AM264_10145 [Escherichia coli]|nr:hypothetical protein AM264_10145 [Escherichia coli]